MTADAIKGVLFDKDGTLIDFDATWLPAYQSAATLLSREARKPALAEHLMAAGGWDAENTCWRPGSLLTSASNTEIIDYWHSFVPHMALERVRALVLDTFFSIAAGSPKPVAGLSGLLYELNNREFILGVATMDDHRTAKESLRKLELDHLVEFVCGADSGFGVKPDPGMLYGFCEQTGLRPEQVLMIGDSPHDLNMGRAAGSGLVVGVLSGAHTHADLAPLADHILDDVTGVLDLLH